MQERPFDEEEDHQSGFGVLASCLNGITDRTFIKVWRGTESGSTNGYAKSVADTSRLRSLVAFVGLVGSSRRT